MNNSRYQAYSLRQLSPFQGTIQVVRSNYARALSADGSNWQIQVSCEVHQQEWGIMNSPEIQRRYVVYGVWNHHNGLSRLPLDPTLDIPSHNSIQESLISVLEVCARQLPFPQKDVYELWILDIHGLPMALAASATEEHNLADIVIRRWRAHQVDRRQEFIPARAECGSDAVFMLEHLVKDNTRIPISTQWFLRKPDGSGTALHGQNLASELQHRNLQVDQFPELLLREYWPDNNAQLLCEDYHNWLAPRLLCLQTLSDDTRERLELAAQQQALQASRFFPLYPKIINPKVMNKIRVEATLRKSLHSTG